MKSPVFLYHALAAACILLLTTACSNSENIGTWDATKPDGGLYQLEAQPATNIEFDRATLTGTIKIPQNLKVTEYGFYYGTSSDTKSMYKSGTVKESIATGVPFSTQLSGLKKATTYYYCVYAVTDYVDKELHRYSDNSTYYGPIQSFTTPEEPTFISTLSPTSIYFDGAIMRGRIVSTPLEDVVSYGFYYGTSEQYMKTVEVGTTPTSAEFSYELKGLDTETKYTYYAYVKVKRDSKTTGYKANSVEFTTTQMPTVIITDEPAPVEYESATLKAHITSVPLEEVYSYGFYYGTNPSSSYMREVEVGKTPTSNDFSYELKDLDSETKYYYYAYVMVKRNSKTTSHKGETVEFTTAQPPIFANTDAATSVDYESARLKGHIAFTTLEDVISYGFCYKSIYGDTRTVEVGTTPTSNEYSYDLTKLNSETKYIYYAYVKLKRNNKTKTYYGNSLEFSTLPQPKVTKASYKCTITDNVLKADAYAEFNPSGHTVVEAAFLVSRLSDMNVNTTGYDIMTVYGTLTGNTCKAYIETPVSSSFNRYIRPYFVLENGKVIYGKSQYLYDGYDMSISY